MIIYGHRGVAGIAPENTLLSFQTALEKNIEAIELDVQYVDGQLWVFHDRHLARLTNETGFLGEKKTDFIQKLRIQNQPIPTLTQVLDLILNTKNNLKILNIELKGQNAGLPTLLLLEKYQNLLKNKNIHILISSFDHRELVKIRENNQQIDIGVLSVGAPLDFSTAKQLNAVSVNINIDFIDEDFVQSAHKNGLKVLVYTVNLPEDVIYLKQIGVDGIFSDFPHLFISNNN